MTTTSDMLPTGFATLPSLIPVHGPSRSAIGKVLKRDLRDQVAAMA